MYTLHIKTLELHNVASVYAHNMQKDLSDWINISKIEIDAETVREISKSISEE